MGLVMVMRREEEKEREKVREKEKGVIQNMTQIGSEVCGFSCCCYCIVFIADDVFCCRCGVDGRVG